MPLRNLLVRVGADITGLTQGMNNAAKQIEKFNKKATASLGGIKARLGGAIAGIGGGMLIQSGVEDAIKYEALMGTLGESLGSSIEDFKTWQNEIGSSMGFSKLAGADLANTLSLNFKKIATDQKDLVDKTTKMMEMAAIVANKRGMAMTEVSDRIRSAMNQEADGADELGVNVRVAAIEASNAYKMMGASGPWDKLSENMRKTILYHHILEQVGQNLGYTLQDNTQLRLAAFQASLQDTRMALGQAFLPIIYTVLPILTTFMRYLERAFQYVSAFARTLLGIKTPFGKTNSSLAKQEAAGIGAANAMDTLGDATEKAGKKAKKAADKAGEGLQSFDEVHLLAEKAADNATGGIGGGGTGGIGGIQVDPQMEKELDYQNTIYDKISDAADKAAKKIREFFKTSSGWKTMVDGATALKDGFVGIIESKAIQWIGKQIGEDLPDFFDDLMTISGGVLKGIGGLLEIIASFLNNDMRMGWEGWGDLISGTWDIFAGTAGLIFPDLGNKLDEFGDKFDKAWQWLEDEFIRGSESWSEAGSKAAKKLKEEVVGKLIEISGEGSQKIEDFKQKFVEKMVKATIDGKAKWDKFNTDVSNGWNNLQRISGVAFDIIKGIIKAKAQEAYEKWIEPFWGAGSWFDRNVRQPINKVLEGINGGAGKFFNNALVGTFNNIAHKINGVLGGISQINLFGSYPFSFITRYAIPNMPYMAKGGIVTGPTIAMIGEGREHEAVAPISKLQGYIASAVSDAIRFNGGGGANVTGDIVLNLDGRAFARLVKPHLERENKRVGTNIKLNPI